MSDLTTAGGWREATIRSIEHVTPNMVSVKIDADLGPIVAGQHVDVRLTAPDGYQAERSYSIASAPGADPIELLIERIEIGEVSPYFAEVAEPGDRFELRGPIGGHFVWHGDSAESVLLIAGGSGIAPLLAMIRHRSSAGAAAPMLLLYSARTWEDIAARDELFAMEASDAGLTILLTITRGTSEREGDFARRIDHDLVKRVLRDWGEIPARTYICGSNAFVEAASTGVIASGIAPATIRTERYG
jgi:ferredoxin-NADP reductase